MRKSLGALLLAALVGIAFPAQLSAAAADCLEVPAETYDVRVDVADDVYRLGETADIRVTVTRKTSGVPVSDARVGVGIFKKSDEYLYGSGETNVDGRARTPIKLKRGHISPGYVKVHAYAQFTTGESRVCADVNEYGYTKVGRAFRIKR